MCCLRSSNQFQYIARKTVANNPLWCEESDRKQFGDFRLHIVSTGLRDRRRQLCLD